MRHDFAAAGPLRVDAELRASSLALTAQDTDQIVVDVDGGADPGSVHVELTGEVLRIAVPESRGWILGGTRPYRITVSVPSGSALEARVGSGRIEVTGPLAQLIARSGSGNIEIGHAEEAEISAGSGDVTVTSLGTGTVTTGSGRITIGEATGRLQARCGAGRIVLGPVTDVEATAGSGNVTVQELAGRAVLRTGSGKITVDKAVHGQLEARCGSGNLVVRVARGTATLLSCSSGSGRVTSELEPADGPVEDDATLEVRARTMSGSIRIQRAE